MSDAELEEILKAELQKVYVTISQARHRQETLRHYLTRLRLKVPPSVVLAEIRAAGEHIELMEAE